MEVELKRLEDLADAVVNDFAYMRQREQEMRDTNGEEKLILPHKSIVHVTFAVFCAWADWFNRLFVVLVCLYHGLCKSYLSGFWEGKTSQNRTFY